MPCRPQTDSDGPRTDNDDAGIKLSTTTAKVWVNIQYNIIYSSYISWLLTSHLIIKISFNIKIRCERSVCWLLSHTASPQGIAQGLESSLRQCIFYLHWRAAVSCLAQIRLFHIQAAWMTISVFMLCNRSINIRCQSSSNFAILRNKSSAYICAHQTSWSYFRYILSKISVK